MTESLSHKFTQAIDASRDVLYSLAMGRESSPAKAEATLQKLSRDLFARYAHDPTLDVSSLLHDQLAQNDQGARGVPGVLTAMPADVWARLAAAIQIEAARLIKTSGGAVLNPDSVLLSPDPLLAPKKSSWMDDSEAFDLSPPSRFVLASVIAIMIGIALTIYILTRPQSPAAATPGSLPSNASRPVVP